MGALLTNTPEKHIILKKKDIIIKSLIFLSFYVFCLFYT